MKLRRYKYNSNQKSVQRKRALESARVKKGKIKKPSKMMLSKRTAQIQSKLLQFQKENKYCDITVISADGDDKCALNATTNFENPNIRAIK